jgi:putative ABC transport system ATP-binding protein
MSRSASSREWGAKIQKDESRHMVELITLHKIYDSGYNPVHALRGLSLAIPTGQFIAIMGASGSGKSTLLNILGCLDVPTSGSYRFNGRATETLSPDELAHVRNSQIGFVFQNFNLLHRSTALENVALPMVYAGRPARVRHTAALAALERVGLADRTDHMPWQLSGGQQQRVAVARALVNEPRLVLADEPTGNLDTQTSQEIMDLLRELHEDQHLTIILVSHDPAVASYAERIIALRDGLLVADQPSPRCGGPAVPDVRALSIAG